MPQRFETHLKDVLVTCVGFFASSLGVFVSILSVIVSPLFSPFSTPKSIFIGEGKTGPTPGLQHPSQKIRPRHIRQPSSDKPSSRTTRTLSSDGTTRSIYSTGNESRRTPSPDETRFRDDTHYISESPVQSRPSTPRLVTMSSSLSQPRSPRNGLQTHLGIRKRSTLLDELTPEEPNSAARDSEFGVTQGSHEQQFDRADIIISPPTPSTSIFLHSTPGPSEVRFGDLSTPSKPAARFLKSHSKRHSLSAACTRRRKSGKRSSNPPTPRSPSPATTPIVESKWHIATRASQRKKRKSLRIDPPRSSATSPVFIENGDDVGGEIVHEGPTSITRAQISQLPVTPARQGPVRTRPYEAPYFFPIPGSLEAIGYVEKVREERRSALVHPDAMFVRNKKDLKRSESTISSFEKDGTVPKHRGEGSQDQASEDSGKKRSKKSEKGSGDRNTSPSSPAPIDEFGVQAGTPNKLRKSSAPPQLSPIPDTASTPTTPSRPQPRRQGSRGIMRILGKH